MRPAWLLATLPFAACFRLALPPVPDVARVYGDRCAALFVQGELDQAEIACDHALEYQPDYWDALHNKGLLRQARGDRAEAKRLFMRALRVNQDMAQSYNALALLALEDGHFSTARDYLHAALRVNPDYAEARANLGLVHLRSGQLAEAEKAYRHLLLSAPTLSEPYFELGYIMLERQRPADAVPFLSQAVTLEASFGAAWLALGVAQEQLGHEAEATAAYETCAELQPTVERCQQALARRQSSD